MKWIHEIGRKNGQKKKTAIILSLVLGITSFYTVQASVINDAQSKKNEAQKELNQVNNEINRIIIDDNTELVIEKDTIYEIDRKCEKCLKNKNR